MVDHAPLGVAIGRGRVVGPLSPHRFNIQREPEPIQPKASVRHAVLVVAGRAWQIAVAGGKARR